MRQARELNSPRDGSPFRLFLQMLEQIVAIGETEKIMKDILGDASHRPEEHLQNVVQTIGRDTHHLNATK